MLNGNSMYFYVFWELIYFYVICIYVIWETTENFGAGAFLQFVTPILHFRNTCAKMSENYWNDQVLQKTESLGDFGGFQYELLIAFCVAWIMVCLFLIKGVKSSGKITYFTAIFPYLVIAILLVRGLTLEGAFDGLHFYLVPDWAKLKDPEVWNTAANQIFYSLGLAFGSLITLASYSPFDNNVLRMTMIVTTVNCSTSIIAGVVIFCVIGHLAHEAGLEIHDVVESGAGLAFIVYPDAVSRMPQSALFAFLFFFMLLNLGFGSQLALVETVITAVVDRIPSLLRQRAWVTVGVSVLMFLLGLPMVTKAGIHWLNLFDTYSCSYSLFVISFIELSALVYVYGGKKLILQIEAMLDKKVTGALWWLFTWSFTAPLAMFTIFIFNAVLYKPMLLDNGEPIPPWAEAIGWTTAAFSVMFIPVFAVKEFIQAQGSAYERLCSILKPDHLYRPSSSTDLDKINELFAQNKMPALGKDYSLPSIYNSDDKIQLGQPAGESLEA